MFVTIVLLEMSTLSSSVEVGTSVHLAHRPGALLLPPSLWVLPLIKGITNLLVKP